MDCLLPKVLRDLFFFPFLVFFGQLLIKEAVDTAAPQSFLTGEPILGAPLPGIAFITGLPIKSTAGEILIPAKIEHIPLRTRFCVGLNRSCLPS